MPGNSQLAIIRSILMAVACSLLSCATSQQDIDKGAVSSEQPVGAESSESAASKVPPKTTFKNGQELKLARIMDGGACNSEDRGARGLFLVYADPTDIERIKKEQGTQVFAEFEHDIENLSLQAFQESIDVINFDDNPFALDLEDALQHEVQQLISKFEEFVEPAIANFESNTGLTVYVIPFSPAINFILDNCGSALRQSPGSM